jgi:two-component system, NtrC family, sensor histidine kinase HydH
MAAILDSVTPSVPPINLRKRFAVASLLVITIMAASLGWLLSNVLYERMIHREGEVSTEFIQNLLTTDRSAGFLQNPQDPDLRTRFLRSMEHISNMRDPVRVNAYGPDGTIVWSTEKRLVGKRHPDNPERDRALAGVMQVESGRTVKAGDNKPEHEGLGPAGTLFVETYMPIREPGRVQVVGAMEVYKTPPSLDADIRQGVLQLWIACGLGALGLFVTLYWIVWRADRLLRQQQAQLDEAQTLASAVELASAVAHNLRNPLASIRSSAELLEHTTPDAEAAEFSQDIVNAVDRANRWITELVRVSQAPNLKPEPVELSELCNECLAEMGEEMARRHVGWTMEAQVAGTVVAHPAMLRQIVVSIIANALDAMPDGGELRIEWVHYGTLTGVRLTDTGTGITDEVRQRLFRPFFSTKSGGLGIGLALVKKTVEQWHGSLSLVAAQPRGTTVEILLPRASNSAPVPLASTPGALT